MNQDQEGEIWKAQKGHGIGLQDGGSTKDQGPGYWSNTMDDKFAHWNWSKLVCLGTSPHFWFQGENTDSLVLMKVHFLQGST